ILLLSSFREVLYANPVALFRGGAVRGRGRPRPGLAGPAAGLLRPVSGRLRRRRSGLFQSGLSQRLPRRLPDGGPAGAVRLRERLLPLPAVPAAGPRPARRRG